MSSQGPFNRTWIRHPWTGSSQRGAAGSVRPKGPGERSPGLRPKADALGGGMTKRCGLKARDATSRFWLPATNTACCWEGRESFRLEPSSRAGFSRPFRPPGWGPFSFVSQGIGLRPQPWARVSRPVGPVNREHEVGGRRRFGREMCITMWAFAPGFMLSPILG